jgi:hypothetical protein
VAAVVAPEAMGDPALNAQLAGDLPVGVVAGEAAAMELVDMEVTRGDLHTANKHHHQGGQAIIMVTTQATHKTTRMGMGRKAWVRQPVMVVCKTTRHVSKDIMTVEFMLDVMKVRSDAGFLHKHRH